MDMACPLAINRSVHDPHERIPINEPLGPISSSSAIEHESPSYSNGHYAQRTTYSRSRMSPPHNMATGIAYKYKPPSWDHDMPSPSLGACHRRLADGFFDPSVWSSPAGRLDAYDSHTRPSERVSATCRGVELYRFICPSAAIPNHPSTTVHRILPDQFLPHITAQNFVLMRILNGHCNLLRVLACVAPIP